MDAKEAYEKLKNLLPNTIEEFEEKIKVIPKEKPNIYYDASNVYVKNIKENKKFVIHVETDRFIVLGRYGIDDVNRRNVATNNVYYLVNSDGKRYFESGKDRGEHSVLYEIVLVEEGREYYAI